MASFSAVTGQMTVAEMSQQKNKHQWANIFQTFSVTNYVVCLMKNLA